MQTAVSIVALVLSALSLGWQGATFALTGGRVKAELRVGAFHATGSNLIHAPVTNAADVWSEHERQQGYTRPVVLVRVRTTGRMPVTIEQWSLVAFIEDESVPGRVNVQLGRGKRITMSPVGAGSIGPQLPHRLEPGSAAETWAVDAEEVIRFVTATKETFKVKTLPIVGEIELGNGRTCTARGTLRL